MPENSATPPFPHHLKHRVPPELAFHRPDVKDYTRLDFERVHEKLLDLESSKHLLLALNRDDGRTYENTRKALLERWADCSEDELPREVERVAQWTQEGVITQPEADYAKDALMQAFVQRDHIPLNAKVDMLAVCRAKNLVPDDRIVLAEEKLFNTFIRAPPPQHGPPRGAESAFQSLGV
jgi:hypothetical protein